ncbi:MAG: hypothetical protein WCI02_01165 [Planctomycetota bacterium]
MNHTIAGDRAESRASTFSSLIPAWADTKHSSFIPVPARIQLSIIPTLAGIQCNLNFFWIPNFSGMTVGSRG